MSKSPEPQRSGILPYKWELIVLLWFAFFLNQADKIVYPCVLPQLSAELGLSKADAGLVGSVFLWVYAALVPIAGYAGDKFRRKWIVFGSLLVWSSATVTSGMMTGLAGLVLFRSVATGGGEAFYYPAANSLIGQHHSKTRAMAISIHQTAGYAGFVLGGLAAGYVAQEYGWRMAFYLFGGVGVGLALIMLARLRDDNQPMSVQSNSLPLTVVLKALGRNATFWGVCLAFAGFNFAGWGYNNWMPTFLQEKFAFSPTQAGLYSMLYRSVFALVGVLVAGRLSDLWAPRRRTIRLEFGALGLMLGVPFLILMGLTDNLYVCLFATGGFGLAWGIYDSSIVAGLFDVVEPRYRSSAVGILLALGFVVAGFAPYLLGLAQSIVGASIAMASLSLSFLGAAVLLIVAAYTTLPKDYCRDEPQAATAGDSLVEELTGADRDKAN